MGFISTIVLYVVLQLGWTLLSRTFPDLVGGALLKGIERRNAIAVESAKDELSKSTQTEIESLRADYAMLKSSVDFLSASHGEVRAKMIGATEDLWRVLLQLGRLFSTVIFVDTVLLAKEIDAAIRRDDQNSLVQTAKDFQNRDTIVLKFQQAGANDADKDRIFVSPRLWLLFFVIRAVYARAALLMSVSFKEKSYRDWRQDDVLVKLLTNVVPDKVVSEMRQLPCGGLQNLIRHLESAFLAEAARVMSGVHFFADNFSEVQSTLIMEKEKIVPSVE